MSRRMATRHWLSFGVLLIACGKTADPRQVGAEGDAGAAGVNENAASGAGSAGEGEGGGADEAASAGEAGASGSADESSASWSWGECGTIAGNQSGKLSWARFALHGEAVIRGYESGDVLLQRLGQPGGGELVPSLRGSAPSALSADGEQYAELTPRSVRLVDLGDDPQPDRVLALDAAAPCGDRLAFSIEGARLILFGAPATCVFSLGDGQMTTRVVGDFEFAALHGEDLIVRAQERFERFDVTAHCSIVVLRC